MGEADVPLLRHHARRGRRDGVVPVPQRGAPRRRLRQVQPSGPLRRPSPHPRRRDDLPLRGKEALLSRNEAQAGMKTT